MTQYKVQRRLYPLIAGEVGVIDYNRNYSDARRYGVSPLATAAVNTVGMNNALLSAPITGEVVRVVASGTYLINDELLGQSNTTVHLKAGVIIRQTTPNKNIFKVVQKDNFWIYGRRAILYGEGTWSNTWIDIGGHEDRGVQFLGCTNSGIVHTRIRNCGLAGVVIIGGTGITIEKTIVEGTHALSTVLHQGNSYQFGFLVIHDPVYGSCDNILLDEIEAFNVNFGINTVENVPGSNGSIHIPNAKMHDIIGQHGAYIGTSHTSLPNYRAARCGIDGIKLFSGVANEVLRDIMVVGFDISTCLIGQAVEVGISGTGRIYNSYVSGVAEDCARALTMDGDARHCKAVIQSYNMSQRALYVAQGSGVGPTDCVWEIESDTTGDKGAYIAAASSDRNLLKFKGRRPGAGQWLIGVNACAGLTIESPDCRDDLANMLYGIYCEAGASGVKFTGTPLIYGYSNSAIRCDAAAVQAQWHCSGGDFTLYRTAFAANQANNILPVAPIKLGRQTTVNAFVPLWQLTMDDESVYHITGRLVGKLAGSAERRSVFFSATYWRDAAGVATIQGVPTVHHDQKSAGFNGTYAIDTPTVNDVRLLVNSAGVATYDWIGEMAVTKMSP